MSGNDPMAAIRARLEQAEREARGDFSHVKKSPQAAAPSSANKAVGFSSYATTGASGSKNNNSSSGSSSNNSANWNVYKRTDANDDDDSPAAQLNKQHNNFKAQAKIDLGLSALLDTSVPREENRGT